VIRFSMEAMKINHTPFFFTAGITPT